MSVEKRLLLAFSLSMLVIVVSQVVWVKYFKPPVPMPLPKQEKSEPSSTQTPTGGMNESVPPKAQQEGTSARKDSKRTAEQKQVTRVQAPEERNITIENQLYRVVISNRGAVVKEWTLKKFKDSQEKPQTLQLIDGAKIQNERWPLALLFDDAALTQQAATALFVSSSEAIAFSPNEREAKTLTFTYADEKIRVTKKLVFHPDAYEVGIEIETQRAGGRLAYRVVWPAHFGDNALAEDLNPRRAVTGALSRGMGDQEKLQQEEHPLIKQKETREFAGSHLYAGVSDQYFAAIFLGPPTMNTVWVTPDSVQVVLPANRARIFVGPKELDVLKRLDPRLETLVDFGSIVGFIAKPLFLILKWIHHSLTKNYGWAIILLTVFINIALFPLRFKGLVSAQKMQKLQPRIKAIQEKYKKYKMNDPRRQEMNKELMAVYREAGVNPLGGCLPLLLQMPFLIAFYNVLKVAIELRHVSFLWIPDLSQYDKTYLLVIIMVITQFVMQKMTPTPTADPAQARLFMLMPLLFGFMFAKVSSGLVLYWLTGNLVGIAQQFFLNRLGYGKPVTAAPKSSG